MYILSFQLSKSYSPQFSDGMGISVLYAQRKSITHKITWLARGRARIWIKILILAPNPLIVLHPL